MKERPRYRRILCTAKRAPASDSLSSWALSRQRLEQTVRASGSRQRDSGSASLLDQAVRPRRCDEREARHRRCRSGSSRGARPSCPSLNHPCRDDNVVVAAGCRRRYCAGGGPWRSCSSCPTRPETRPVRGGLAADQRYRDPPYGRKRPISDGEQRASSDSPSRRVDSGSLHCFNGPIRHPMDG